MLTGHGTIDTAIEAIRLGAFDYVVEALPARRAGGAHPARARAAGAAAAREPARTRPDAARPRRLLRRRQPAFRRVLELVERVAPTDSTVLITGETGTGKEMVAKLHPRAQPPPAAAVRRRRLRRAAGEPAAERAVRPRARRVHRRRPRQARPVRGGRRRHDLPRRDRRGEPGHAGEAAARARHVDVPPRGRTTEIRVDVRVLAATNRDLAPMVRQGLFREDLYYRLSTITLHAAAAAGPARRTSNCSRDHFAAQLNERYGFDKRLSAAALERLRAHDWPGNVRELLHVVEAAMVVCDGCGDPAGAPAARRCARTAAPMAGATPDVRCRRCEELERSHIERVLRATDGHRGQRRRDPRDQRAQPVPEAARVPDGAPRV